jgi:hypothetical protein
MPLTRDRDRTRDAAAAECSGALQSAIEARPADRLLAEYWVAGTEDRQHGGAIHPSRRGDLVQGHSSNGECQTTINTLPESGLGFMR